MNSKFCAKVPVWRYKLKFAQLRYFSIRFVVSSHAKTLNLSRLVVAAPYTWLSNLNPLSLIVSNSLSLGFRFYWCCVETAVGNKLKQQTFIWVITCSILHFKVVLTQAAIGDKVHFQQSTRRHISGRFINGNFCVIWFKNLWTQKTFFLMKSNTAT